MAWFLLISVALPVISFSEGMAPPTYSDLGKSARDVFGKGFHFGLLKLDVKVRNIFSGVSMDLLPFYRFCRFFWMLKGSDWPPIHQGKSSSGVQLTSGGVTNHETGKVFIVWYSTCQYYGLKPCTMLMAFSGDWKPGGEEGVVHTWWGDHCQLKVEHGQHPEYHTWCWGILWSCESTSSWNVLKKIILGPCDEGFESEPGIILCSGHWCKERPPESRTKDKSSHPHYWHGMCVNCTRHTVHLSQWQQP